MLNILNNLGNIDTKEASECISRREAAADIVAFVVACVTGVSCGKQKKSVIKEPEQTSATKQTPIISSYELEQNERIATIEKAFISFAREIERRANASPPLKNIIPLEVMLGNADNRMKNFDAIRAHMNGEVALFKPDSPRHFYYKFKKLPNGIAAAVKDITREVTLNENFDENNLKDLFFLYHELIHIKDDEERRAQTQKGELPGYPSALTLPLNSSKPIAFLYDEVRANALTLLAMNAYFNGELKKLGEKATKEDVFRLFGDSLNPDSATDREFSVMISQQTNVFFNSGKSDQERYQEFERLVATELFISGMQLYATNPLGYPYPLEVVQEAN